MRQFFTFILLLSSFALYAQTVPTPSQSDQIILDPNSNGKADPGDKIRYKVTIQNTGGATATGTTLNAVPDAKTTFSAMSFRSSPLAFDDGPYTCIGNVGITVPDGASDLLANDFDDAPAGLTCAPVTNALTTAGGTITINANGSFSYSPPRGFEGTDTYIYTVNDGNGVGGGVPATNTATVTFTVSGMIWFINNNAGACASSCDGRMSNPYTTLAAFNTANGLSGGLDPADNDNIFIYESATAYTSGIVLRNGQKLFGQDATVTLNVATGLSQPTFGNVLPVTNSGNSTVATITNSGGNGVTLASGNTIRGLTIDNVSGAKISGTNFGTLTTSNLIMTGPGAALNLDNGNLDATVTSLASTSSVTAIKMNNVTGNLNALGSSSPGISGATGPAIEIIGGSVSMIYNPGIAQANNAALLSVSGGHSGGTLAFQSFSLSATNGTGMVFDNADGTYNINVNTTLNGGAAGVSITNGSNGNFSFSPGVSITNPSGAAFLVSGGGGTISYAGSISKNNAGRSVDIQSRTGGSVTMSGNLSSTGTSTGINVSSCTGGTVTFSGSTKTINTGANTAVTLSNNSGATINFTGGGLTITTTSGTGFDATGGATAVTVQGTGNTISSTTGTALNVNATTIGASGLTFQSISANGAANGIILNNTGNSAGLTVTGTGSAGSGGTIQNCTGAGVSLATTSNVSLSRMNIQGGGDDGINGSSVTGFSLSDCTVTNNGNSTTDEGIELNNLLGTCSMSNCTVTNNAHNNFKLLNNSGTLASLTVSGSTFEGHNNASAFSNNGFLFETASTAAVTSVLVNNNSIFRNNFALGMQILAQDNSTISSFIVNGCTFTDTGTGNSQEIAADFSIGAGASMTYQFLNNTLTNHNSHAFNTFTGVGSTGSLRGTIEGNTIGNQANIDSGSKIGNGMRININGGANARIKVNSNTIHQIPTGRGIECIARNGTGGASFIVTNNTITAPTGTAGAVCGAGVLCPLAPIHVQTNCVTVCNSACSVVSGNTAYDPTTVPGGAGSESSVQLWETGASALTYEGNVALTALQNLTNANPACVTKSVLGTITVVAASTCAVP